jgi:hypothetical protein
VLGERPIHQRPVDCAADDRKCSGPTAADPRARIAYPDWGRVADHYVAQLKGEVRRGDPHAVDLVVEYYDKRAHGRLDRSVPGRASPALDPSDPAEAVNIGDRQRSRRRPGARARLSSRT